jgi:prephenate dehydrogenase
MVPGCRSCVSERDASCLNEVANMKPFDRVVIVGVGLLGGSIGLALRERKLAKSVVGVGRSQAGLQQALELGAITEFEGELSQACAGADLTIICTPVQQVAEWVRRCQPLVSSDALITDVGSTKRTICELLSDSCHENFCGSHPLAGSDKSGVAHAHPQLFEGRLAVVTPTQRTPLELLPLCGAR